MRQSFTSWALRVALAALVVSLVPMVVAAPPAGAAVLVDEFDVPANSPAGTNTNVALDPTVSYVAEVSRSYNYSLLSTGLGEADGECHNVVAGAPMLPFALDPVFGLGVLDLFIGNLDPDWVPRNSSPFGCDDPLFGGTHTYVVQFSPTVAGLVNFHVFDINPHDNTGFLHVRIFLAEAPEPINPTLVPVGAILVDAHSSEPATSLFALSAGQPYVLESHGTFNYLQGDADAECSNDILNDPQFRPARWGLLAGLDWLDLLVNGDDVDWVPQVPDTNQPACSVDHVYRTQIVPAETGLLSLKIHDSFYGDNSMSLLVIVYLEI